MFYLISLVFLAVLGLDETNEFDGDWKVMSIIKSLDPNSEFIPTHIDDIAGM